MRAEEHPAYDLTLACNDYPLRETAPVRTILLCTHQRSGSTLLGESIYFAGGLGCPLEYFHPGFRPALQARWKADDLPSYARCVQRYRTSEPGVLAVKLFWRDVEQLVFELDPRGFARLQQGAADLTVDTYREIGAALSFFFPNPTVIHLVRQDRVRQAVSHLVAAQTQVWRSIPCIATRAPGQRPSYDYRRIADFINYADYCHAHWDNFFAALDIVPLRLTYEDLLQDHPGTVARVLRSLGRDVPVSPRRMLRQASGDNEKFALQFLRDHVAAAGTTGITHQQPL